MGPAHAGARAVAGDARLFFAAWPDEPLQHSLHDLACRQQPLCGGRPVPLERIHLTLAFLGKLPLARVDELFDIAGAVAPPDIVLTLDRIGYWRGPQVVWAGAAKCPDGLTGWVAGLTAALRRSGFRTETRAFVPHVTLLRKARRAPPSPLPAEMVWPLKAYSLVESVSSAEGLRYRILQRWPG